MKTSRDCINDARNYLPKMECYPVAELHRCEYQVCYVVGSSLRFYREPQKALDDAQVLLAEWMHFHPNSDAFIVRVSMYVAKMC